MKQHSSEDGLLRKYFLGELSQKEGDDLEERLLKDDELFELAEAVEADLLAAAARGELAPAEREQVLKKLASSPQGRERLALARTLNRAADEEHRQATVVVEFPRRTWTRKPAFWTAMAASLLAAVIGFSVLERRVEKAPQEEAPVVTSENPIARPVPRPSDQQPADLPVTETPPVPDQAAREEAPPDVRTVEPLSRVALQLVFLAGQRGAGEAETAHERLHLTPDVRTVDLKLDVTDFRDLKSFKVAVRNNEHNTIWEKSGLEPRDRDGESALVLEVPAAKLATAGLYEVRIEGTSESGELEELPLQEFQVVTSGNP